MGPTIPAMFATILAMALVPWPAAAEQALSRSRIDIPAFLAYQHTVREAVASGRRFRHLDNETRQRLFGAQDQLFGLLEGKESIEELDNDEQVAVYNAQGVVNAVLADAELDREVCTREQALGSHRVQTVCMTIREREEMREFTQDQIRRRKAKGCSNAASSSGAMVIGCAGTQ